MFIGVAVAAIVVAVLIFAYTTKTASQTPTSSSVTTTPLTVSDVPFTLLVRGIRSKVTERVNYLIESPEQLSSLWKMIDATSTPPTIDFNTHSVIAVFAGERPTSGYAVTVAKIEDSGERMVSIALANPDSTCVVGQSFTSPYEVITASTTSLPLTHKDLATTTSCRN